MKKETEKCLPFTFKTLIHRETNIRQTLPGHNYKAYIFQEKSNLD